MTTPQTPADTLRVDLGIHGMTCASCVGRAERALKKVPGVQEVSVNLATESARVMVLPSDQIEARLKRAVRDAGYEPVAANAAIDHMRDWALGTNGKWVTMGIPSDGQYGIPKDTMFGFPVTCEGGEYKLVEGLEIDAFSQERINKTLEELQGEQAGVAHLL